MVWHAPQDFPSDMSTIEYFTEPRFTPMNISGWQSSHPFQTVCFLWEKMMSGIPSTFGSSARLLLRDLS